MTKFKIRTPFILEIAYWWKHLILYILNIFHTLIYISVSPNCWLHLNLGRTKLMMSSIVCRTPSPSQRPMEPPAEERKEVNVGWTREVVVTSTVWENWINTCVFWELWTNSVSNLVSVDVVVQGRGQVDTSTPLNNPEQNKNKNTNY